MGQVNYYVTLRILGGVDKQKLNTELHQLEHIIRVKGYGKVDLRGGIEFVNHSIIVGQSRYF